MVRAVDGGAELRAARAGAAGRARAVIKRPLWHPLDRACVPDARPLARPLARRVVDHGRHAALGTHIEDFAGPGAGQRAPGPGVEIRRLEQSALVHVVHCGVAPAEPDDLRGGRHA